jgi:hypothetical protein
MQYLLPCSTCDKKHPIEPRQAGQQISCVCGAVLEVPSLRGIRQLTPVAASQVRRKQSRWSLLRGLIFVGGLVALVLGLVIGGYGGRVWLGLDTSEPLPENLTAAYASIERMTPDQTLVLWQEEIRNHGLGRYQVPSYVVARSIARFHGFVAIGGACLILFGAAVSLGTVLFRKA